MKKTEMIFKIAKENGLTRNAAQCIYDSCISTLISGIKAHDSFVMPGIGTFEIEHTKNQTAQDSKKETTDFSSKHSVIFKPAKSLREAVQK